MDRGERVRIDGTAFETYRRTPNARTTLPRLLFGVLITVVFWGLTTLAVLFAGTYAYVAWQSASGVAGASRALQEFIATPFGILTALSSFSGIWLGIWIAMRWIHAEPLRALFGISRRVAWPDFAKGLVAVLITSLFSEVLLYCLHPEIGRSTISLSSWLVFAIPVTLLAFVQTSSEELLFRGYLPRGLASRFRSPLIWGLLPLVLFTALHWSPATSPAISASVLVTIASFALLLMVLVYTTGNLGAAFGAHLANNLAGFLLISHQESYNAFALFNAKPLEGGGWTSLDAVLISAIGVVSCLLTALLLLHPRSPLRVKSDPR